MLLLLILRFTFLLQNVMRTLYDLNAYTRVKQGNGFSCNSCVKVDLWVNPVYMLYCIVFVCE